MAYTMKTKKSLAKRTKAIGNDKFKIHKAGRRHLAHGKTTKVKRHMRKAGIMAKTDVKRFQHLMQASTAKK